MPAPRQWLRWRLSWRATAARHLHAT